MNNPVAPPEPEPEQRQKPPSSLRSQLLWAVNGAVALAFLIILAVDHQREMTDQLTEEFGSLESDANIHHEAILRLRRQGRAVVQDYLDTVGNRPLSSYSRRHKHQMVVCVSDMVFLSPSDHPMPDKLVAALQTAARAPDHCAVLGDEELIVGSFSGQDQTVYVADNVANLRWWLLKDMSWRLAGILGFAIVLGGVINMVVLRLIVKPLDRLVDTVQQIAQGKLGTRTSGYGCAELYHLAGAINSMSGALEEADRQHRQEMAKARRIQQHLLPRQLRVPGLKLELLYLPATEVAGDYCDLVPLADGSFVLCIADVTGHGVPAALTAAMLKALLLHAADVYTQPAEMLAAMNARFTALCLPEDFASLLLVRWSPQTRTLEYASAGHEPGVLLQGQLLVLLSSTGPLLGVGGDDWTSDQFYIQRGDRLLLFTDGLTEADGPSGLFGRKRLMEHIVQHRHVALGEIISGLRRALDAHRQEHPQHDDLTVLVIEFVNPPESSSLGTVTS